VIVDNPRGATEIVADRLVQIARSLDDFDDPGPIASIVTDGTGTVVFWSRSATDMYGWTPDEVLGRSIMTLTVGPDDADQATEIMAQLGAGRSWTGEFRCRRRDGTPVDVHVIDVPIRNRHGDIIGICGFSLDVSLQRAALERRVERAQEILDVRLAAAEEERRRIVADLHDEIGQLVSAARTDLLGIRSVPGLADPVGDDLDRVVTRLDDVMGELRRMCADLLPPTLEFTGLASALAEEVSRFAERAGIEVDLDVSAYDGQLPDVAKIQVFRIAQAALFNVERHAGATRVMITLMHLPGEPGCGAPGGSVVFEVSDDGVGIDADEAQRASALRAEVGLGSGIGLDIMRHRARLVGGFLTVGPVGPRGGTRVRLVVPLADVPAGDSDGAGESRTG